MKKIALISCVSKKVDYKAKARELYRDPLFKSSLAYAEKILKADEIYILSAKYGLVEIEEEIEPYDLTLNDMKKPEREAWAKRVLDELSKKEDIENNNFAFLAGKNYREYLEDNLPNHENVLGNRPIGKRVQFMQQALGISKKNKKSEQPISQVVESLQKPTKKRNSSLPIVYKYPDNPSKPKLGLDGFKFTVHSQKESFRKKLLKFLAQQPITLVYYDKKLNRARYRLNIDEHIESYYSEKNKQLLEDAKKQGEIFFTLKITNNQYYTFTFENLSKSIDFEYKELTNEKYDARHIYQKIFSDERLSGKRITILKDTLGFIYKQGLYSATYFKDLSFVLTFDNFDKDIKLPEVYGNKNKKRDFTSITYQYTTNRYENLLLIHYHNKKASNRQDQRVYDSWQYSLKKDVYTNEIKYYQAQIYDPSELVKIYQSKKTNQKELSLLSNYEIQHILEEEIGKQTKYKDFEIVIDDSGRFFIQAANDDSIAWNETINISPRNQLKFVPVIDNKTSYFKIEYSEPETVPVKLYKSEKEGKQKDLKKRKKEDIRESINLAKNTLLIKEVNDFEVRLKKTLADFESNVKNNKFSSKAIKSFENNLKSCFFKPEIEDIQTYIPEVKKEIENLKHKLMAFIPLLTQRSKEYSSRIKKEKDSSIPFTLQDIKDNYNKVIDRFIKKTLPEKEKLQGFYFKEIRTVFIKENSFKLQTKEQLRFIAHIQRWETTNKDIIKKYKGTKKHSYTLNDQIDDIANYAMNFLSKYDLIEVTDTELLNTIVDSTQKHYSTHKKLKDEIEKSPSITSHLNVNRDQVKKLLHNLLNN